MKGGPWAPPTPGRSGPAQLREGDDGSPARPARQTSWHPRRPHAEPPRHPYRAGTTGMPPDADRETEAQGSTGLWCSDLRGLYLSPAGSRPSTPPPLGPPLRGAGTGRAGASFRGQPGRGTHRFCPHVGKSAGKRGGVSEGPRGAGALQRPLTHLEIPLLPGGDPGWDPGREGWEGCFRRSPPWRRGGSSAHSPSVPPAHPRPH